MLIKTQTCPVCHGSGERRASGKAIGPVEVYRCGFCKGHGAVQMVDNPAPQPEPVTKEQLVTAALCASERALERLSAAVQRVYLSAWWQPDRDVGDKAKMWEELRDAAGLAPGTATKLLGEVKEKTSARIPGEVVCVLQPWNMSAHNTRDRLGIPENNRRYYLFRHIDQMRGMHPSCIIFDPSGEMLRCEVKRTRAETYRLSNIVMGWDACRLILAADRDAC